MFEYWFDGGSFTPSCLPHFKKQNGGEKTRWCARDLEIHFTLVWSIVWPKHSLPEFRRNSGRAREGCLYPYIRPGPRVSCKSVNLTLCFSGGLPREPSTETGDDIEPKSREKECGKPSATIFVERILKDGFEFMFSLTTGYIGGCIIIHSVKRFLQRFKIPTLLKESIIFVFL